MWLVSILFAALVAAFLFEKSKRRTHPVSGGLHPEITLPHTAEFELYHNALSLCSMKARFCLAELGIDYVGHHVHLIETGAYETLSREFLRVNPAGTVPVLVHEGHPVYESHEQIVYAAEHAPPGHPALMPDDPAGRAEVQRHVDGTGIVGDPMADLEHGVGNAVPPLIAPLFAAMIDDIPVWKILEGLLFHIDRRRPVVFLALELFGLRGLPRLAPAMKLIERSRHLVAGHLDVLEAELAKTGGPWILGERFTLAHVGWCAIFERLRQACWLDLYLGAGRRPECAAYWERLRARPSYHLAIVANGHPTIDRGMRRLADAKAGDPVLRRALDGEGGAA
jgi:glutathione S-transferase